MVLEEDAPALGYVHGWNPSSKISLDGFLDKHKPSIIRNDGRNSKPSIWVLKSESMDGEDHSEAIEEAKAVLEDTTKQVLETQANDEIPVRKRKGVKNKKEVREEITSKATSALKEIAQKHGFVAGKWLAFAPEPQIDGIYAKLAHSLISGELAGTKASQVRVTTRPAADVEGGTHQHNLSIYFPDVYDEEVARDVMKVLLRHHGLKLAGAKANLYTALGLDSKHASGIPSTVWKGAGGPGGPLSESEVQALRSAYYEEQGASKGADNEEGEVAQKKATSIQKRQVKADDSNPFASDEDEEMEDAKNTKGKTPAISHQKRAPTASKKRPASSDSENEEEAKAPPKKAVKANASAKPARRGGPPPKVYVGKKGKKAQEDSESDE